MLLEEEGLDEDEELLLEDDKLEEEESPLEDDELDDNALDEDDESPLEEEELDDDTPDEDDESPPEEEELERLEESLLLEEDGAVDELELLKAPDDKLLDEEISPDDEEFDEDEFDGDPLELLLELGGLPDVDDEPPEAPEEELDGKKIGVPVNVVAKFSIVVIVALPETPEPACGPKENSPVPLTEGLPELKIVPSTGLVIVNSSVPLLLMHWTLRIPPSELRSEIPVTLTVCRRASALVQGEPYTAMIEIPG